MTRSVLEETGHRPEATEGHCDGCPFYGDILLTAEGEWLCIQCLRRNCDPSQEFTSA